MLEAANAKGAVGVVNVRFEAVRINNNASELLSYGTSSTRRRHESHRGAAGGLGSDLGSAVPLEVAQ